MPFIIYIQNSFIKIDADENFFNYIILIFIVQNWNLPLFVSYAQIAIAKVPTTIRINPASAFLLNFSLNTK